MGTESLLICLIWPWVLVYKKARIQGAAGVWDCVWMNECDVAILTDAGLLLLQESSTVVAGY